jgi:RNA polymerase sigma-70 factor, ECF subfamily
LFGDFALDWDIIVPELGPRLHRYFCASFARATAADLVQEVLIRLVHKVRQGEYDASRGSVASYAFGLARLVRLEELKRTPRETFDDGSYLGYPSSVDLEAEHIARSRALRLRRAIHKLKDEEQDVVLLMVDQHLSMPEIAEILSMPNNTVKSHVHRAKEKLRELLRSEP